MGSWVKGGTICTNPQKMGIYKQNQRGQVSVVFPSWIQFHVHTADSFTRHYRMTGLSHYTLYSLYIASTLRHSFSKIVRCTVSALLSLSDTSPLHIKRMKLMACEAYKIINELSPTYTRDLINVKVSQYNFRNEHQASLPQVNSTRYGLKSFRYEAARIWNSLPNNIRTAESFPHFKRLIRTWDGINCKCSSCSVYNSVFQCSCFSYFHLI